MDNWKWVIWKWDGKYEKRNNNLSIKNGVKTFTSEEVKNTILKEFPKTLKIIVSIFSNV